MLLSKEKLQREIEKIVKVSGLTYLEAILSYCEDKKIDPEDVAEAVSPALRSKIRTDAIEAGHMRATEELPVDDWV